MAPAAALAAQVTDQRRLRSSGGGQSWHDPLYGAEGTRTQEANAPEATRTPRATRTQRAAPGRLPLLDDLHAVAVGVAEPEHRRNTRPPQHLVHVHAAGPQVRVQGFGVRGHEPDPGLHASGQVVARADQRDRRRLARRGDLDPAPAAAHIGIEALLEAQPAQVELKRPVLIRNP